MINSSYCILLILCIEAVSLPLNLIPNCQILLEEQANTEKCVSEKESDANIFDRLSDLNDVNQ